MIFLLGVLLGMLSGAIAMAAFNGGDYDEGRQAGYGQGFERGVEYGKHAVKWDQE